MARCHAAETESTKLMERVKHLGATIDGNTTEIRRLQGENTSLVERLRTVGCVKRCRPPAHHTPSPKATLTLFALRSTPGPPRSTLACPSPAWPGVHGGGGHMGVCVDYC